MALTASPDITAPAALGHEQRLIIANKAVGGTAAPGRQRRGRGVCSSAQQPQHLRIPPRRHEGSSAGGEARRARRAWTGVIATVPYTASAFRDRSPSPTTMPATKPLGGQAESGATLERHLGGGTLHQHVGVSVTHSTSPKTRQWRRRERRAATNGSARAAGSTHLGAVHLRRY